MVARTPNATRMASKLSTHKNKPQRRLIRGEGAWAGLAAEEMDGSGLDGALELSFFAPPLPRFLTSACAIPICDQTSSINSQFEFVTR